MLRILQRSCGQWSILAECPICAAEEEGRRSQRSHDGLLRHDLLQFSGVLIAIGIFVFVEQLNGGKSKLLDKQRSVFVVFIECCGSGNNDNYNAGDNDSYND